MKLRFGLICLLLAPGCLILNSPAVSAQQATPPEPAKLPNVKGKSYHEARKILLARGWKPFRTINGKDAANDPRVLSGNGPLFWSKGYFELENCSGTGLAYCSFLFRNAQGRRLRVVTAGEETPDDPDGFASVVRLKLLGKPK